MVPGCAQPPHGERGTLPRAIPPIEPRGAFGLVMGIGARVEGPRESKPGEQFVECLVAQQTLTYHAAGVASGGLRVHHRRAFEESTLGEGLATGCRGYSDECEPPFHCSRRSACSVNSSSFKGTLNPSFSMRSTV